MDPAIWGPDQWKVLFDVAKMFELSRETRNGAHMKLCKEFLSSLAKNFLCEHCGYFFGERLAMYNSKSMDMVDWVYNLKHIVSNKIHICKESTQHCSIKSLPCDSISRIQFYNRMFFEDYHRESWARNILLVFSMKRSMEFLELAKKMLVTFMDFENDDSLSEDEFFDALFQKKDWKSWRDGYIECQTIGEI